jgi:hypothetical protein
MSVGMKPIQHHLQAYGQWLIVSLPGAAWERAAAVKANLALWERVYGAEVATEVRSALRQFVKSRRSKA